MNTHRKCLNLHLSQDPGELCRPHSKQVVRVGFLYFGLAKDKAKLWFLCKESKTWPKSRHRNLLTNQSIFSNAKQEASSPHNSCKFHFEGRIYLTKLDLSWNAEPANTKPRHVHDEIPPLSITFFMNKETCKTSKQCSR